MGFFKKFSKGLKRSFTKIGKGVKRGIDSVGDFGKSVGFIQKGPQEIKAETKARIDAKRKGEKFSFGKDFVKGFRDAATQQFSNLQAPTKAVKKLDPLRNTKVGKAGFSPISLLADVATAPITTLGLVGQTFSDKKEFKKLKSGDADKIIDLSLAPLSLVGTGAISGGAKAISKGLIRAGLKSGTKAATKAAVKTTATTATRGISKIKPKSTIIKGKFDESTIKFKPIKDIPKTTKVPKQTLSKAQRLKQAKTAIKSGQRITKQF